MNVATLLSLLSTVMVVGTVALDHVGPRCRCGRDRFPLHDHNIVPVLFTTAVTKSLIVVSALFVWGGITPLGIVFAILWLWLAVLDWWRLWLHERDNIRRAAKSAGRVVRHASGRLVVAPNPHPGAA